MKLKSKYVCSNCGYVTSKWMGQCTNCNEWNSIIKEEISTPNQTIVSPSKLYSIKDLKKMTIARIDTGLVEFNRVLGGDEESKNVKKAKMGIVSGSVVLVSGEPGVGKSTLLLQVCANIAATKKNVVYVSGEESVYQVGLRLKRIISSKKSLARIKLVYSFKVEEVIATLEQAEADFAIIDSIQTMESQDVRGMAGGIAQVKASTYKLVQFAKEKNITLIIIGHINKEGNIAGPKILEHLVDTVIQLEGDKQTGLRIVRSLKNRFGATNEVGILKMTYEGLEDVSNISDYFLTKKRLPGICKSAILEGNRILIVEVQSLIVSSVFSLPKRVSEGVSVSRLQLLSAIIQKYIGINLSDKDIYLNIAGGFRVHDRSIDLAIILSIISSYKNKIVDPSLVAVGEIALTGHISSVNFKEQRMKEIKRLGYKSISGKKFEKVADLISIF